MSGGVRPPRRELPALAMLGSRGRRRVRIVIGLKELAP